MFRHIAACQGPAQGLDGFESAIYIFHEPVMMGMQHTKMFVYSKPLAIVRRHQKPANQSFAARPRGLSRFSHSLRLGSKPSRLVDNSESGLRCPRRLRWQSSPLTPSLYTTELPCFQFKPAPPFLVPWLLQRCQPTCSWTTTRCPDEPIVWPAPLSSSSGTPAGLGSPYMDDLRGTFR